MLKPKPPTFRFWAWDVKQSIKLYMSGQQLLRFLRKSESVVVCGADLMTDDEFARVPNKNPEKEQLNLPNLMVR
jgi:hypothetical protein